MLSASQWELGVTHWGPNVRYRGAGVASNKESTSHRLGPSTQPKGPPLALSHTTPPQETMSMGGDEKRMCTLATLKINYRSTLHDTFAALYH